MDMSTQDPWSFELGEMEDPLALLNDFPEINCLEDILPQSMTSMLEGNNQNINYNEHHHQRHQSLSSAGSFAAEGGDAATRPSKQPRLGYSSAAAKTNSSSPPVVLNFGTTSSMPNNDNEMHQHQKQHHQAYSNPSTNHQQRSSLNNCTREPAQTPAKRQSSSTTKTATGSRDHILAERKRREKITQQLIALASLLPDLKKMDKSSVIGEAIKYIKELREKLKDPEEDNGMKLLVESTLPMQNSEVTVEEDDISSSGDNEDRPKNDKVEGPDQDQSISDIEVRVCNNSLLIKLQCEKREAILPKILNLLEKLHLPITSVHATPFGDKAFDIAIITQMEKEIKPQRVMGYLSAIIKGS